MKKKRYSKTFIFKFRKAYKLLLFYNKKNLKRFSHLDK